MSKCSNFFFMNTFFNRKHAIINMSNNLLILKFLKYIYKGERAYSHANWSHTSNVVRKWLEKILAINQNLLLFYPCTLRDFFFFTFIKVFQKKPYVNVISFILFILIWYNYYFMFELVLLLFFFPTINKSIKSSSQILLEFFCMNGNTVWQFECMNFIFQEWWAKKINAAESWAQEIKRGTCTILNFNAYSQV